MLLEEARLQIAINTSELPVTSKPTASAEAGTQDGEVADGHPDAADAPAATVAVPDAAAGGVGAGVDAGVSGDGGGGEGVGGGADVGVTSHGERDESGDATSPVAAKATASSPSPSPSPAESPAARPPVEQASPARRASVDRRAIPASADASPTFAAAKPAASPARRYSIVDRRSPVDGASPSPGTIRARRRSSLSSADISASIEQQKAQAAALERERAEVCCAGGRGPGHGR